jgi:hypothetical protein
MLKNMVFAVVILGIVALLYSLSTKEFLPIPPDENHKNIIPEEECQDCHREKGENPLSKEHPPKHQCFECHEREIKSEE